MPAWLVDLFAQYGYAVVFVGVLLENSGLPVPGETVLLAGSALAHGGLLSLPLVMATATVGAILGDNVGFLIGRRGGRAVVERLGRYVGITPQHLEQFDGFFLAHGAKTVFVARFVTGLRVVGALLAGGSQMRWPVFLFYNASGAAAWSVAIGLAGYLLGHSWATLEEWIGRTGLIAFVIVAILAVVAVRRGRRPS